MFSIATIGSGGGVVGAVVAPREEGGHDGKSWRSKGSGGIHWMSVLFAVAMGVRSS